jgi:hypothetical protein
VEKIFFPDWNLKAKARVDTGAMNSSLHVDDLESVGENRIRFQIADCKIDADVSRKTWVKSANGQEKRLFVKTVITLGPVRKEIELNLTSRKGLTYPMLLGRSALSGLCLVDPGRQYLLKNYGV